MEVRGARIFLSAATVAGVVADGGEGKGCQQIGKFLFEAGFRKYQSKMKHDYACLMPGLIDESGTLHICMYSVLRNVWHAAGNQHTVVNKGLCLTS